MEVKISLYSFPHSRETRVQGSDTRREERKEEIMKNLNKWGIRGRAAKDVSVDGDGKISGSSWDQIKQYQKEFQQEFCPSCFHFDPKKNDFREKGHSNNPKNCKRHWTDIAGQCRNYRKREEAEKAMVMVKEAVRQRKKKPVITLPSDPKRITQLKIKLLEYQRRFDPYKAPELQMGTICKMVVLERLLKEGKINAGDLSKEMAKTYGSGFNEGAFLNACSVIEDYCLTGGANVNGGTGLPSV